MNPYVNKVTVNEGGSPRTIIDVSGDTAIVSDVAVGKTFHLSTGEPATGIAAMQLVPIEYDYNIGYIANGTWKYENPTKTYTDFYEVIEGHRYFITLGAEVGSRFRAMTTDTDVREMTRDVAGTQIINLNNPASYANVSFVANTDGYLLVAKDNVGKTGVKSYVYDGTMAWL